jgi:hypothetical protein
VMAKNNIDSGHGAYLHNQNVFNSAVTIIGYGIFNGNDNEGLLISSNGAVTLANLTANSNTNEGVEINNFNNATTASYVNVTLTGTNTFNGNGNDGLNILSDGIITLNNITANDNAGYGAKLDNTIGTAKNIILNGVNTFINNSNTGLHFNTNGSATLTRVTANSNNDGVGGVPQSAGVYGRALLGSITFTCGSLNNNEGTGYDFGALSIILKGVYTYGNGLINNFNVAPTVTRACPLP